MGTRADFYVGRGRNAEWLGSIANDGYPEPPGLKESCPMSCKHSPAHHGMGRTGDWGLRILGATNEADFREAVNQFIGRRKDGTGPAQGWPWPWDDSRLTDYVYAWDNGVYISYFGSSWWSAAEPECTPPDYKRCHHYARTHVPEAKNSRYGMARWLGHESPRFDDAVAVLVRGKRLKLDSSGSRGSRDTPRKYDAEPGYWWMWVDGQDRMVCVARLLKSGHRLLPNVQLVFPHTAVGPETITEPGALISDPPMKKKLDAATFPNMKMQSNFTTGPRSGVIIFGVKKDGAFGVLKGD